jgi:small conductance mechanosensitive channel
VSTHAIDRHRLFILLLAFAFVPAIHAQSDGESMTPERAEEIRNVVQDVRQQPDQQPWQISIEALNTQLLPLRKDQLGNECEAWIGHLQAKMQEIADAKRARSTTEDEAQLTELRTRITELEQHKSALIDRCDAVVGAFEAKGGDAEEYDKYLAAVGGIGLDVSDTGTALMQFRAWLVSEDGGMKWLWAIVKFFAILIAFWILSRIVGAIVKRAVAHVKGTSALLREFLSKLSRKVVMLIGAVVAVGALGVDIGPLVAAIGAAGLVIGFALQGTLSNFASGIMILLYKPYDVGHFIEAGGVTGTVETMTLVSTTLVTPDNQTIIVPNNAVWGGTIKNVTGRSTRRVDMTFGISYSDDIDKAKAVLEDIVASHAMVLKDPAPNIQVTALADSSVNFIVRPWVNTADYWAVYWDMHAEVKRRFDKENIGIPFPQMDVHWHKADAEE